MQFWKRWLLAQRPGQPPSQQQPSTPRNASRPPVLSPEEARRALTQLFAAWELRRAHPLFKNRLLPGEPASPSQEAGLLLEHTLHQITTLGPHVIEPLLDAVRAESGTAQALERARLAALALGRLGALSAVPALLEALRDQRAGAAPVRAAAAAALGQVQAEAAASLAALDQPPHASAAGRAAAEALHAFPLEPVITALSAALRDSSPQVRAASAAAFLELLLDDLPGNWFSPDPATSAVPPAPSQGQPQRTAARAALGPLSQALTDPDPTVRRNAATALGWLGDAQATRPLAEALSDPDERCRSAAALALGMLGTPAALKPLALALTDPSSSVRQSAAQALGQLANPVATDLLLDVLHDPAEPLEVRATVARALGKLRLPQVISPLRLLLEAPEPPLRAAAVEALGALGFGHAHRLIAPLLWRDPDRAVRHSAARALARLAAGRQRSTRWRLRLALRVDRQVRQEALLLLEQQHLSS